MPGKIPLKILAVIVLYVYENDVHWNKSAADSRCVVYDQDNSHLKF